LAVLGYSEIIHRKQGNINCTISNCPYPNNCVGNTVCLCDKSRANHFIETNNEIKLNSEPIYCQYERKKLLTAFLLEFFIPIGAGHLYSGLIAMGVIKMVVCLFLLSTPCWILCTQNKKIRFFLMTANYLIFSFWWLFDVIYYGVNKYVDGNGVLPEGW
jgi:hypothetical protein